jgi:type IV fimbrial biogenesis protein FimT
MSKPISHRGRNTLRMRVLTGRAGMAARGFTLVELMTVVAMFALLIAVASPAFNDTVRSNRIDAAVTEVRSALALARSEAVKRASFVAVDPVTGTDWASGVRISVDRDNNPSTGPLPADTLVRQSGTLRNISVPVAPARIVFDGMGNNIEPAADPTQRVPRVTNVQLNFDSTPRCVRINGAGRVNVTTGAC